MLRPVEAKDLPHPLHLRFHEDRPSPQLMKAFQHFVEPIELEVDPFVLMEDVELTPIAVIPLGDRKNRLARVGEREEELLLDLLELATHDLEGVVVFVVVISEIFVLHTKFGGEKGVDEGEIVIELAYLEDLLAPQP